MTDKRGIRTALTVGDLLTTLANYPPEAEIHCIHNDKMVLASRLLTGHKTDNGTGKICIWPAQHLFETPEVKVSGGGDVFFDQDAVVKWLNDRRETYAKPLMPADKFRMPTKEEDEIQTQKFNEAMDVLKSEAIKPRGTLEVWQNDVTKAITICLPNEFNAPLGSQNGQLWKKLGTVGYEISDV